MAATGRSTPKRRLLPSAVEHGLRRLVFGTYGFALILGATAVWVALATWSVHDPSLNNATPVVPRNLLGGWGAVIADLGIQTLGLATIFLFLPLAAWGWHLVADTMPGKIKYRLLAWPFAGLLLAAAFAGLPQPKSWPLPNGLGGILGDFIMAGAHVIGPFLPESAVSFVAGLVFMVAGFGLLFFASGTSASKLVGLWAPRASAAEEWANAWVGAGMHVAIDSFARLRRLVGRKPSAGSVDEEDLVADEDLEADVEPYDESRDEAHAEPKRLTYDDGRIEPSFGPAPLVDDRYGDEPYDDEDDAAALDYRITRTEEPQPKRVRKQTRVAARPSGAPFDPPPVKLLQPKARITRGSGVSDEVLQENATATE